MLHILLITHCFQNHSLRMHTIERELSLQKHSLRILTAHKIKLTESFKQKLVCNAFQSTHGECSVHSCPARTCCLGLLRPHAVQHCARCMLCSIALRGLSVFQVSTLTSTYPNGVAQYLYGLVGAKLWITQVLV